MLNDFLVFVFASLLDAAMILAAYQYFRWWRNPAQCLAGGTALATMLRVVMDGPTWSLIALTIAHVGALFLIGNQATRPATSKTKVQPQPRATQPQSNVAASLGFKVQL